MEVADIKTADMLDLPRPKAVLQPVSDVAPKYEKTVNF